MEIRKNIFEVREPVTCAECGCEILAGDEAAKVYDPTQGRSYVFHTDDCADDAIRDIRDALWELNAEAVADRADERYAR